jgi:tetratricopeptide (TPR) repeat protein
MSKNREMTAEEFQEIEHYILHQMGVDEEVAFTARLSADAGLRARTDELKLVFVAVQENALESRLSAFHEGINDNLMSVKKERGVFRMYSKWLVAASVTVVLSFSVWWSIFRETKPQRLFSAYYKPDPGLITVMGISENYAFDHAMIEYKTGNYKIAIIAWDSLRVLQPTNDTLNYFLGSALLGDKQPGKATVYLQKVSDTKSAFANDANWYLGLALLEQGKEQEAIQFIKRSNHPKKQEVLKKLTN